MASTLASLQNNSRQQGDLAATCFRSQSRKSRLPTQIYLAKCHSHNRMVLLLVQDFLARVPKRTHQLRLPHHYSPSAIHLHPYLRLRPNRNRCSSLGRPVQVNLLHHSQNSQSLSPASHLVRVRPLEHQRPEPNRHLQLRNHYFNSVSQLLLPLLRVRQPRHRSQTLDCLPQKRLNPRPLQPHRIFLAESHKLMIN